MGSAIKRGTWGTFDVSVYIDPHTIIYQKQEQLAWQQEIMPWSAIWKMQNKAKININTNVYTNILGSLNMNPGQLF